MQLTLEKLLELHEAIIGRTGGSPGIRDMNAIESALAQPEMSFGDYEMYPSLAEKAAALGFSLIKNHAFVDGNKRIGHYAMEYFLALNGLEISDSVDNQEKVVLGLAASEIGREEFLDWLQGHLTPLSFKR